MERVPRIEQSKIREDSLLCKIIQPIKKSTIILLEDSKKESDTDIDYMEVIGVGSKVSDIIVGDLVMKWSGIPKAFKINEGTDKEELYALIIRYNCDIIIDKHNFKK